MFKTYQFGNIFRSFGETYLNNFPASVEQIKAIRSIRLCRTPALGGRQIVCEDCGNIHYIFNSCGNRSCPICQSLKQQIWLDKQMALRLPVDYFHVIFTLPQELNELIKVNQRLFYSALFKAAWRTVDTLCSDEKWLGAKTGMLAVLHTWGQNLSYHPHLHCLIPAGGLHPNGKDWVNSPKPKFFVKHKELQKTFKKEFILLLREAFEMEQLKYIGKAAHLVDIDEFRSLYAILRQKRWVVRIEKPLPKSDSVFEYLAKYTHRIAMSDYRIQKIEKGRIYFDYKDYRSQKEGQPAPIKTTSLKVMEFIRRFLQHVLPKWFQKIRYYGIMATACRKGKLAICQKGLKYSPSLTKRTIQQILQTVFGLEPDVCPACGSLNIVTLPVIQKAEWINTFLNVPTQRPPPNIIKIRVETPIF